MNLEHDRYHGFYHALVRRPVTLAVVFIALLVVGIISYMRIPVQMMPDGIVEPGLQVWVSHPGASAQENEEKVARVLEEQLRTLSGIEEITSSSSDDFAFVSVNFDANTDMELAKAEVRDRVERARPQLPKSVQEVGVWSWSESNMPAMFFAILHPGDSSRTDFLVDTVVQRRIEGVDGVGKLEIWGVLDDSLRILLDEDKVRAANLDIGALIGRLSADNFALPLGEIEDGGRRVLLRSDMRFRSHQEIEAFPIGGGLVIGDIGHVAAVKSVRNRLFKIDGSYAFYGEIQKDSQSNVVETCTRLRAALKELEQDPRLGGEFKFLVLFDQGQFIETSLGQLEEASYWGGGLAVLVLLVFLGRIRSMIAAALAIPFSALLAIAWIHFSGGSFNVLTMTGITLAMGMLVDDAVVVIENITRVRAGGRNALEAASIGTREVALAVVLSTLTTVVVFLPLIFITENPMLRIMFAELGSPLCLAMMFSLVAALVFLPVVAGRVVGERGPVAARLAAWVEPLAAAPARALAWSVGAVRLGLYASARALAPSVDACARFALRFRLVLSLGLLALIGWSVARAAHALLLAQRLPSAFGWSPSLGMDDALIMALELAAPLLALLIVAVVLPAYARAGHAAPVRPTHLVSQGRSLLGFVVASNHAVLEWTLKHRLAASCLAGLVLLSQLWPQTHMNVAAFGQEGNTSRLNVAIDLEENFTLAQSEGEMEHYERWFLARKSAWAFDHIANRFDTRSGRITLYWDNAVPRERYDALERSVREELVARPGHRVRLWSDEGEADERSRNVVTFRLVGPSSEELERIGERAIDILERVPGLSSVSVPEGAAQSQVRVVFDDDVAQGLGVSAQTALQNIAWALRGWMLPRYQEEGREVPLIIEYDSEKVAGLDTLKELDIWNGESSVPLSTFSHFQFAQGSRSIQRRGGQTTYTLQARVDDTLRQKELSDAGYVALQQLDLPRGYSIGEEDLVGRRQEQEFQELFKALLLAMVLSYIVMAVLFESLLMPFVVMFTVPYAIVGAFWTLYLTGTAMDSVGYIGIIILVGVVAKNGIVLIDCVQRLRVAGQSRTDAVLNGSALRIRPVLMTALTTVMGLIPMALQEPASDGIDYRALATCVAGGLSVSTILTLWVVPLAYVLCDDLAQILILQAKRAIAQLTVRRRAGAVGETS